MIGKTTRVLRENLQDCHGDTLVEVLAAAHIIPMKAMAVQVEAVEEAVPLVHREEQ